MRFKISFSTKGIAVFVVPENGCSKPSFGRKRQFWEERAFPVGWWGPRPAPLYSWAHCRSSLAHTPHFFLEAVGLGLTDGSSGNAGAGTAAPLRAAGSHSCCCWSHSNSLSSSSYRWSENDSPDALPKNKQRMTILKVQADTCAEAIFQPPLPIEVQGRNELPEQQQEQVWQPQRRQQNTWAQMKSGTTRWDCSRKWYWHTLEGRIHLAGLRARRGPALPWRLL